MGQARLIDVAAAAGVSLRTASRVLNGDHRVAIATRERVDRAMRDLAFEPDAMARSLRAGTDTTIGLVIEAIADPFFAAMADAVEAEMAVHGRAVLVASTRRDRTQERDVVRRLIQRRVAGLLVVPTGDADWVSEARVPVVLADRGPSADYPRGARSARSIGSDGPAAPDRLDTKADLVDIDDYQAAFDAVTHLVNHGHQRIAYIGDSCAIPTSAARVRGYRDALTEHGLPVSEDLVTATGTTSAQAAQAAQALIDGAEAADAVARSSGNGNTGARWLTAIFSATTRASLGIIPVLHARGRTDLAVVGLGDFAMADALQPAVTVIDHSGARLGAAAAQRLLARIADPSLPVEHQRLETPLIRRGSGELRP